MEDSQSSDLFLGLRDNVQNCSNIEIETYTELVSKIKAYECSGEKSLVVPEHLNIILSDCKSCISQSLEIIVSLIEDSIDRVCGYIEDAVCILQILSNFVKTIIESVPITCRTHKNFSTFTGSIILSVFTHCQDSECIYGNNLFVVEKQLKELFRSCHELQMTYLMVLEKHILFDLNVNDDQVILEKTLEINLKIGDVVQSLDVKTMAEQWKAYTMICEKYSSFLSETFLFNRITKLLASTIETNIRTTLEADEKDKIVLRSLKVACFSLKILLKICNVFKCSVHNDYEDVVKLLLNISLCNSSYYELSSKTPEFSALMNTHLVLPSDNLIDTLANEKKFLDLVLLKDITALSDIQLLEHILLLTSTIRVVREKKDLNNIEDVIIPSMFTVLPVCHKWFNMGLKLKFISKDGSTYNCGLYEYILLNVAAFSTTFSSKQYKNLEKYLYESLLGTDYYCSLFASHLWVILCRISNDKLQLDTLIGLLRVYQKLESHISFNTSPQRVHLSYTIEKLFKSHSAKMQIYRQFNVTDAKNFGAWSVLKLQNLQNDVSKSMDRVVVDSLLSFNEFSDVSEDSFNNLVKLLRVASTCSIAERDLKLEEFLLRCWLKACPVCHNMQTDSSIDFRYFRYLEGLISLTECYMEKFGGKNLLKILKIISKILLLRNDETVHLLFIFFCKLSSFLLEDENVKIVYILGNTIKNLIIGQNDYHQYIFSIILANDEVNKLITPLLNDPLLKNVCNSFINFKNKFNDIEKWQYELDIASKYKYKHKCVINKRTKSIDTKNYTDVEEMKITEGNFDLGDIDSMFEESEGEEPAIKKAKMHCDVEGLIVKLEVDVDQLSKIKDNLLNVEYKARIKQVCDKLKSMIS